MAHTVGPSVLDPASPGDWAAVPTAELFTLPRAEVEAAQGAAFVRRFDSLGPRLEALDKLATRQGVDRVESPWERQASRVVVGAALADAEVIERDEHPSPRRVPRRLVTGGGTGEVGRVVVAGETSAWLREGDHRATSGSSLVGQVHRPAIQAVSPSAAASVTSIVTST